MPLQDQIIEFDFSKGISEKQAEWLQADGFLQLENCAQEKTGEIIKHHGYTEFSASVEGGGFEFGTPPAIGTAPKLISKGSAIGCIANGYLYGKGAAWTWLGRCSPWVAEQRTIIETDEHPADADTCISGDWMWVAWVSNSAVKVSGTYLPTNETTYVYTFATGQVAKCRIKSWDDAGAAILVYSAAADTIEYAKIEPDLSAVPTNSTLLDFSTSADIPWDFTADADSSQAYLIVMDSGAPNVYRFSIGASTLTQTHGKAVSGSGADTHAVCIAYSASRDEVFFAYAWWEDQGGGSSDTLQTVNAAVLDGATVTNYTWGPTEIWQDTASPGDIKTAGNRIERLTALYAGTRWFLLWTDYDLEWDNAPAVQVTGTRARGIDVAGSVETNHQLISYRTSQRSGLAWDGTRVFFLSDDPTADLETNPERRCYIVLGYDFAGPAQPRRFHPLGHFAYLTAGSSDDGLDENTDLVRQPSIVQDSDGVWRVTGLEVAGQGQITHVLREYRLYADDRVGISAELGHQTYFTGAMMSCWDGLRVLEAGWLQEPHIAADTLDTGTLSGTYLYRAVYARISATGEILRSAISNEATAVPATNLVVVYVTPYTTTNYLENDKSQLFCELYRTEAGGTEFYLAQVLPINPEDDNLIEFEDDLSDADLRERNIALYSDGSASASELLNDPPIPATHLCNWRNRIFLTDGEKLQYSKEGVDARSAEFASTQTIPKALTQNITAIAPLDDYLAVFTPEACGYVYGDGPGANGSGSTYVGPVQVQGELGCIDAASVVATQAGVYVRARRGIYMLGIDRAWRYIGEFIERTLETYPSIRDGAWIHAKDRVMLAATNAAKTDGVFLVYDLFHQTWSVLDVGLTPSSILSVNGSHTWMEQDGTTHDVSAGNLVSNTGYSQRFVTPWLKPAGVAGEIRARRLWLMLEPLGDSGITVDVGYNYQDDYPFTMTIAGDDMLSFDGAPGRIALPLTFRKSRCESFRVRVTETPQAASGPEADSRGHRFVAMRFKVAPRRAMGTVARHSLATLNWTEN